MIIFRSNPSSISKVLALSVLALASTAPLSGAGKGYYDTQQERAENSDIIVIAKARAFDSQIATGDIAHLRQFRVVRFEMLHVVKGDVDADFDVDPIDYVAEFANDCCDIGSTYVLYLNENEDLHYPADRFSIVPIDGKGNAKQ